MAVAPAASYDVYVGTWTDWSRGGTVLGATLTLTRQDGGLLIAFLAFFVALVGTRFWRIACLALHWAYSKETPADGIHHQRQAFLRNSPNPESAIWTLFDMGFSWRQSAEKVWSRLASAIGLALACFVGFILAGGYSSRAATFGSTEVVLSGSNCGFVGDTVNMSTYGDSTGPMMAKDMIAAESYARQCYNTSGPGSGSCSTYVKRELSPAVVDTNADCPFDNKVCKSTSGNLFIDTGFIDSHYDLGRNTPPTQRVQFRRTIHCAPLAVDGYRLRTYDDASKQSFTTYHYGPLFNVNGSKTVNFTTRYLLGDNTYPDVEDLTRNAGDTAHDFGVRSHYSLFWNGSIDPEASSFFPIEELRPQHASLSIFFLSSGNILFSHPTGDGWYGGDTNATEVYKLKNMSWGNTTMYRQSEPGSPLACRELEQYCLTGVRGVKKCTPLQSFRDAFMSLVSQLDEGDYDWFDWFELTTFETCVDTRAPLSSLGTQALRARDSLNGPILGPLPSNQWQLEVQHWHATAMAQTQSAFLRASIGPPKDVDLAGLGVYVRYPRTPIEKELCANQKVLVDGYISFRVFAIAGILVGGGLIILLSFTLEPILSRCVGPCRSQERARYTKLEWSSNETLQLQRLAHEAMGTGTWSRGTGSVPVTRRGDLLAVLDIRDPKHPKLRPLTAEDIEDRNSSEEDEDPVGADEISDDETDKRIMLDLVDTEKI